MPKSSTGPLQVLGICGSLRKESYNLALLRAAMELAPAEMVITEFQGLGDIPPYNQDVQAIGDPEPVVRFKDAIRAADALLIATPEYNYGISGVLKNAIDWASRPPSETPLNGKPTALMGASTGASGTMRGQLALRQSFVFTNTPVLLKPEVYVSFAATRFDAELRLTDDKSRGFVRQLLEGLITWTRRLSPPN
jgi:chromate reductase